MRRLNPHPCKYRQPPPVHANGATSVILFLWQLYYYSLKTFIFVTNVVMSSTFDYTQHSAGTCIVYVCVASYQAPPSTVATHCYSPSLATAIRAVAVIPKFSRYSPRNALAISHVRRICICSSRPRIPRR